jgi:nicotinamidase-related amidase
MLDFERHPNILVPQQAVLVVVDMQEPFLNVMHERERLVANVRLLVRTAVTLNIPVLPTTQYAERMGGVSPAVTDHNRDFAVARPIDKLCFSCAGVNGFLEHIADSGRRQILLCGVETHICVSQTALDLTHQGYQVHVAADAVSSRTLEKHKLGMERMRDSGVLPCAAEAAVYELLREAGTPAFKSLLPFIKS